MSICLIQTADENRTGLLASMRVYLFMTMCSAKQSVN